MKALVSLQKGVGSGAVPASSGPVQHEREEHQESAHTHPEDQPEPGASGQKGEETFTVHMQSELKSIFSAAFENPDSSMHNIIQNRILTIAVPLKFHDSQYNYHSKDLYCMLWNITLYLNIFSIYKQIDLYLNI